eukprot:scpid89732/ scgid6581/ 
MLLHPHRAAPTAAVGRIQEIDVQLEASCAVPVLRKEKPFCESLQGDPSIVYRRHNSVGFAPDESDDPEQFFVGTTAADKSDTSPWFAELQVGTTMVRFKLDTGADVSTMSKTVWLSISPQPTLQSTKVQLRGADDQLLPVCGVFSASLKYKGKATDVRMYVLERASGCLLSRSACDELGLVKRVSATQWRVQDL